jgi:hypothetical protein
MPMNQQMLDVMQRRAELLARIAAQREEMAEIEANLKTPLALADKGLTAVRFLRSNPMLVAAVTTALFVVRRRGVLALAVGAWRVWRGCRSTTSTSAKPSPRFYRRIKSEEPRGGAQP